MTPPRWGGAGQVRGSENRQLVSSVGILQHDIAVRAVTLPAPRNGVRHGRWRPDPVQPAADQQQPSGNVLDRYVSLGAANSGRRSRRSVAASPPKVHAGLPGGQPHSTTFPGNESNNSDNALVDGGQQGGLATPPRR